jgi:hypothetical protein
MNGVFSATFEGNSEGLPVRGSGMLLEVISKPIFRVILNQSR